MRLSIASTLLLAAGLANAASTWGFSDGVVTVASKGAKDVTQKFTDKQKASNAIELTAADTIKVTLTTKDGSKAKRPHQAFLIVRESSGLEAPFPMTLKDSGKSQVELSQKDLPGPLLTSKKPLQVSIVIGSFGSSAGMVTSVFEIAIVFDTSVPEPTFEAPLRYKKQPLIHHTFRSDPKNPPKIISLVFSLAVLATVPALFVGWLTLGANVSHAQKALGNAPLSHGLFFGSVIAMEGVFFMYYTTWNLFQALPAMGLVGVTAFLSGSKALGEVRSRRLAGER